MQQPFVKGALALVIAGLCGQSMANGLAINEQSVSGMGTAFAGRSSSAQDASTVFGNPAGMSRLQRSEVSGGFAFVNPSTDIDNVSSGEASAGDTEYRCVYVKNNHGSLTLTSPKVWIQANTPSGGTAVEISLGTILCHETFTVFRWIKQTRIYIEIRVAFLN